MKSLIFLVVLLAGFNALAADDLADARTAFDTMVAYQKTDDMRTLDLFGPHCLVVYKVVGGASEKTLVMTTTDFLAGLKKEIALKHGNKDDYEDVQFAMEGDMVKVTAKVHFADSGKRGPFSVVYGRDADGVMKIQEFRVTLFSSEPAK